LAELEEAMDVDFIAEHVNIEKFLEVCRITKEHEFILMQGNIDEEASIRSTYENYLNKGFGVRFMLKDTIVPNIKFKFSGTRFNDHSLKNSYKVFIDSLGPTHISQLNFRLHIS
jgi:hypothetical protein